MMITMMMIIIIVIRNIDRVHGECIIMRCSASYALPSRFIFCRLMGWYEFLNAAKAAEMRRKDRQHLSNPQ